MNETLKMEILAFLSTEKIPFRLEQIASAVDEGNTRTLRAIRELQNEGKIQLIGALPVHQRSDRTIVRIDPNYTIYAKNYYKISENL
jgi:hypothetical protein